MNDAKTVFLCLMLYIFWTTILHMQYLLPTCRTVSLFVTNYCSDIFCQPHFLVIFRELASLLTYTAYGVTYAEKMDFIHQCLNI